MIHLLPPEEARRIAAGEVVDRPAALVREFMDNAIDSGAGIIEVSVEEGGSKKIEVSDNGCGMAREDLEMCWLAHATSKINTLEDLQNVQTLGFRGEALAAAASSARLEILSGIETGEAWKLSVGPGGSTPPILEQYNRTKGCTVRALNLFDSIPARKQFLKRTGSEAALCRQVFLEKAMAHPGITFRFIRDGVLKDFLPPVTFKKDRYATAYLDPAEFPFLHEIHIPAEGFYIDIVIGGPEIFRSDRRLMYIFTNGRKISEYSFLQAMEYGVQGFFPNGTHPAGAVFITVNPALADFNIHPAKREVRFKDPGAIHHAISSGLRSFFHHDLLKTVTSEKQEIAAREAPNLLSPDASYQKNDNNQSVYDISKLNSIKFAEMAAAPSPDYCAIKYRGIAFGLFIMAESGDSLFFIDQHAAHERVLYDQFLKGQIPPQKLLIPLYFTCESSADDNFLREKQEELSRFSIVIAKEEQGWRIDSLPALWRLSDTETIQELLSLRNKGENIGEHWAATFSCRHAVKDGDYLDESAALALAKEVLSSPVQDGIFCSSGINRCPHGRPLWTEISLNALRKAVKRD